MPKPSPKKLDLSQITELCIETIKDAKFPMLATMDGDQPRLRPISPVHRVQFKIYFANLRSYHKTAEIAANNKVELCYMDSDHNQVRITGCAEIETDRELLQFIWRNNRILEHYLGSLDNPELVFYRVEPTHVRYMQEWALEYHEVEF